MKTIIVTLFHLFLLAPNLGGEHYSIYLNNNLITQQVIAHQESVPTLLLPQDHQGSLAVHYDHCGQLGKNRELSLQNKKNEKVKTWTFDDSPNSRDRMMLDARSVAQLIQTTGPLHLVYTSKELPKGRVLAKIELETRKVISRTE